MKKFLALALFAVMVLALIPTANALDVHSAYFVSKKTYNNYASEYDKWNAGDTIKTELKDTTYSASKKVSELTKDYADKYDAAGSYYYGVYIPVASTIAPYIGDADATVTVNGDKVVTANYFDEKSGMTNAYYYIGFADLKAGFNRTFTWVATKAGSTTTVKYTVKLNILAEDAVKNTADLNYSFSGAGDGWAISTKNGAICLDIASDYILNHNLSQDFTAVAKLTVNGKSPVADGQFGYLSINYVTPTIVDSKYVDPVSFKNTDTIKVTFPKLSYYTDSNDMLNLPVTSTLDIKVDTKTTDYIVKGVRYIIRSVAVGDPRGIYFVDGDTKNVGINDTFTLELAGKEATLMTSTNYINYEISNNIIYQDGDKFVAIGAGTVYVTASYKYEYQTYTDTIKVVVTETPATSQYYVVCRALNIRKGPGTSYSKAGLFYRNNVVDVISVSNGWAKIWYKNANYYVSFKYLAKI